MHYHLQLLNCIHTHPYLFIQHVSFHILWVIWACLMSTKSTTTLKVNQETSFIAFYVPPQNWKGVRSKTILRPWHCKMNIWLPKMEPKKITSISNTVPKVVGFGHEQIMHGLLPEKCSKPTIKWLAKNKNKPLRYPTCEGRERRKEGRKGEKKCMESISDFEIVDDPISKMFHLLQQIYKTQTIWSAIPSCCPNRWANLEKMMAKMIMILVIWFDLF